MTEVFKWHCQSHSLDGIGLQSLKDHEIAEHGGAFITVKMRFEEEDV